ncbi:MAG: serine hydrolase [Microthrixaceae bacterium]
MDPVEALMVDSPERGHTDALLILQHGEVLSEHYAPDVDSSTPLRSWSMAKSMVHAAVGLLVQEGRIQPDAPAAVPEWAAEGDPRSAITLTDLLQMRPGLAWNEDYVDGDGSDVIEMLFARDWEPVVDTGGFAASKALVHEPGSTLNYSSGTTNIVARLIRDLVGPDEQFRAWLQENLFGPLGMDSPIPPSTSRAPGSDPPTVTAPHATSRFGELYLNDGRVGRRQLLDPAWIATASRGTGIDEEDSAHLPLVAVRGQPVGRFPVFGI